MANEGFFTSGGTFDAVEMRRYNAALVDNTPPGGVMWGMGVRAVSGQVVIDSGSAAIADGAGGVYIIRLTATTPGIVPPGTPGTYVVYAQEQDPGSGATAGEAAYGIASALPATLAIPLGTVTVASGGGLTIAAGSRRTAKVMGTTDAATLNGKAESTLSVASAASATSATKAAQADSLWNDAAYAKFHWSGQPGQPSWVWGGNAAGDMYVWNPANFNVAYVGGIPASRVTDTAGTNTFSQGSGIRLPQMIGGAGTNTMNWRSSDGQMLHSASTRRVKRNIVDLSIGVAALRGIRPVEFEYNTDLDEVDSESTGTFAGFIAEEVEEVFPDAVSHDSDGQVTDVHDRALLAGAYKLIADLYERIEALEAAQA